MLKLCRGRQEGHLVIWHTASHGKKRVLSSVIGLQFLKLAFAEVKLDLSYG